MNAHRMIAVAALLSAVALADDKVEILEPKDRSKQTRRVMKVAAKVEAGSKVEAVTVEVTVSAFGEKKSKTVPMTAVKDRDGAFEADVKIPARGNVELKVRAKTAGGATPEAAVVIGATRDVISSAVLARGSLIPSVKGKTTDGKELTIDSKGPVLVHFYSAWGDCKPEVEWLAALHKKYAGQGLTIVGVASVAPADYKAWESYLAGLGSQWQNLPDADGEVGKGFYDFVHHEIGSQLDGCMTYVLKDGKVEGGDYVAWDFVGEMEMSSTLEALGRLFP